MSNTTLFSSLKLGHHTLANRLIMAPLTRNRADEGNVPTDMMVEYYRQRAGAGLIVTEATQVSDTAQGYPNTPGVHSEEQVVGWRRVTDAVHAAGGKIFMQLWHTGRASHPSFRNGTQPVAPSAVANRGQVYVPGIGMTAYPTPRALELREIRQVVDDFASAARNAVRAGFDGVEIHGANGYLIDQFIRSGTNHRTDEYGGSPEKRARFALEVTQAVADAVGPHQVGIRLSPSSTFNDMSDATPRDTFSHVVRQLAKLNLAYLHLIAPTPKDARHGGEEHDLIPISYFREFYPGVRIANGGYTRESAQDALVEGWADAVAFGTAFLANPDLPERFRRNAPLNTPDPSTFYGGTEKGYIDYPPLSA